MMTANNGLPVDDSWLVGIRTAAKSILELLGEMYATSPSEIFDSTRCIDAVSALETQAVNWVATAAQHCRNESYWRERAEKAEQARDVLAEAMRSLAATQPKRVDETAYGCRLCNRIIRKDADHCACPVTLAKAALTKAGVER